VRSTTALMTADEKEDFQEPTVKSFNTLNQFGDDEGAEAVGSNLLVNLLVVPTVTTDSLEWRSRAAAFGSVDSQVKNSLSFVVVSGPCPISNT
jgi:hypothetical protein